MLLHRSGERGAVRGTASSWFVKLRPGLGTRLAVQQAFRKHGNDASPAWLLLNSWLDHEPCEEVQHAWRGYARGIAESAGNKRLILLQNELLNRAQEVAEATGGVFGIGAEERVLQQIDEALPLESYS